MKKSIKTALIVGGICALWQDAHALSLAQALSKAYNTNPTLSAQRAQVRATDEGVIQAKTGFLPDLAAQFQLQKTYNRQTPAINNGSSQEKYYRTKVQAEGLTSNLNVFNGGSTVAEVRRTKADVMAARAALMLTEQDILTKGIKAFMDVLTDRKIIEYSSKNVAGLEEQLRGTEVRVSVGDLTKSNTDQVLANLEGARAQLISAQSDLQVAEATYAQIFGEAPPADLEFPSEMPVIPETIAETVDLAKAYNPAVMQAKYTLDSSRATITREKGELLPKFDLQGNINRQGNPQPAPRSIPGYRGTASFQATVSVPIFDKGVSYSKVRQAMEVKTKSKMDLVAAQRAAEQAASQSVAQLVAATKSIEKFQAAVKAAKTALDGMIEEQRVGSRTTLEVLDAEQKYFSAQTELVSSQRNKVIASYNVLASMGALDAMSLRLDVDYYNPTLHYENGLWIGWASKTDADYLEKRPDVKVTVVNTEGEEKVESLEDSTQDDSPE